MFSCPNMLKPVVCVCVCVCVSQAQELVKTNAYQQGDSKQALVDAFLRMDEMVSQESVQAELQALAGPKNNAEEEEEYASSCSSSV